MSHQQPVNSPACRFPPQPMLIKKPKRGFFVESGLIITRGRPLGQSRYSTTSHSLKYAVEMRSNSCLSLPLFREIRRVGDSGNWGYNFPFRRENHFLAVDIYNCHKCIACSNVEWKKMGGMVHRWTVVEAKLHLTGG